MDSQTRRVQAHSRHLAALELRKAGATYELIAGQLGYASRSGAFNAVESALKVTLRAPTASLRELSAERLDRATMAIWRSVNNGDVKAIDQSVGADDARINCGPPGPTGVGIDDE